MKTRRPRAIAALLLLVGAALTMTGCAGLQESAGSLAPLELRQGLVVGYLKPQALPNSLALLPPPPAPDSTALALDEEAGRAGRSLQGTARWTLAARDADLGYPGALAAFSCALDAPITEAETPHLVRLLRRSLADAALATVAAKDHYRRSRPFLVNGNPICTPHDEDRLKKSGSYPSGHATIGWTWALILAELAPERIDPLSARGLAFGQSRVVCNVHWQSDVQAGLILAASVVARLHADPAFRADLESSREELAALRVRGRKPTRDCRAEAAALALRPPSLPGIPAVRGGETVTYRCQKGERIVASYYTLSDDSLHFVKLRMPDGRERTLPQGLSASGARYTDEGQWVWWIKGDSARLETRGPEGEWRSTYEECHVMPGGR